MGRDSHDYCASYSISLSKRRNDLAMSSLTTFKRTTGSLDYETSVEHIELEASKKSIVEFLSSQKDLVQMIDRESQSSPTILFIHSVPFDEFLRFARMLLKVLPAESLPSLSQVVEYAIEQLSRIRSIQSRDLLKMLVSLSEGETFDARSYMIITRLLVLELSNHRISAPACVDRFVIHLMQEETLYKHHEQDIFFSSVAPFLPIEEILDVYDSLREFATRMLQQW